MTPKRIDEKLDAIHQQITNLSIQVAEIKTDVKHFSGRVDKVERTVENHWKVTKWVMAVVASLASSAAAFLKGSI